MTDCATRRSGMRARRRTRYDPALLFPVDARRSARDDRRDRRAAVPGRRRLDGLGVAGSSPGKPQVAVATLDVPATSPRIVESKSVKLYLGSLSQTRFASREAYAATLARDLGEGRRRRGPRHARAPPAFGGARSRDPTARRSTRRRSAIDATTRPTPRGSRRRRGDGDETLKTSLFRSLCPVTGQPDYATVHVAYRGPRIDRGALLALPRVVPAPRRFHEHCVERIFVDIVRACRPKCSRSTRASRAAAASTSTRSAPTTRHGDAADVRIRQ